MSGTKSVDLIEYGDIELWYAKAHDGTWMMPLFINWRVEQETDKHYAYVSPAFCPYISQSRILNAILQLHDIQGRMDRWLIPREIAEAILLKAPGLTPYRYYRWPGDDHPMIPVSKPMKLIDTNEDLTRPGIGAGEDFSQHISSMFKIPIAIVRLVFRAIESEAPEWMLENRKPLELGFCRLLALPFRPNWKEIVGWKFRKCKLLSIFNKQSREKYAALEKVGMPAALCSTHNIALKRGSNLQYRVSYVIEALPCKPFEKAVNIVESKRIAQGRSSYIAQYEKTIEAMYHHILDVLENYTRKAFMPFARIFESSRSGQLCFLPTAGHKVKVHGKALRHLPVHIVERDSRFSVQAEESDENLVRSQATPMQKVPNLLQASDDLWKREKLGEMGGEPGANGVPVCDAVEEFDAWKSVLSPSKATEWKPLWLD